MSGSSPKENNEPPKSQGVPERKCDRCSKGLQHPIFHTVYINDGKEICGECMDVVIIENQNKNKKI
jgi:hypothetical protein